MAAGAWFLQQPVARSRRPLLWYAGLELFCAVWTAGSAPFLPGFCDELIQWIGLEPGWVRQGWVCLGAPCLVLGPVTAAMGATLPAMDAALRRMGVAGKWTGWLYGLNTVGAMAGALLAVGWLMPRFGFARSLEWAASIQAVCGLLAIALALKFRPAESLDRESTAEALPATSPSMNRSWFAFASGDRKKGFRLRRQAVQWILDLLAADLAEEAAALCAIARAEDSHV